MTDATFLRLAVIGDPVEHSRSPALHRVFLSEAGRNGSYEAIRVAEGGGARAIDELRSRGYLGLNVTTPLKEEAFARADWRDPVAIASGSVNTLLLGKTVRGYNTDGIGALGVLQDAGIVNFAGARVLILGAGPTARAATVALIAAGSSVSIWNRTAERAQKIAQSLGARVFSKGVPNDAAFAALPPDAMPEGESISEAVRAAPIFVDANYGDRATLARALGRHGVDGTRMLEHSARASFELWADALGFGLTEERTDRP
jgi:shikimate dehydrogenase